MRWEQTQEGKKWAKDYHKQYYLKNKEKLTYQMQIYLSDPEVRARKNELDRRRALEAKKIIYDVLGGAVCKNCGCDDIRVLQLDHINGGGSRHYKKLKAEGQTLHSWLIKKKLPPGFQVLCHNCNFAKGHYDGCPHENLQEVMVGE